MSDSEPTPPADDVREALAEVIEDNRTWTRRMSDGYLSSGSNDGLAVADAILAAFEVRPRGTLTNAEVNAAYGVLKGIAPVAYVRAALEAARAAQP